MYNNVILPVKYGLVDGGKHQLALGNGKNDRKCFLSVKMVKYIVFLLLTHFYWFSYHLYSKAHFRFLQVKMFVTSFFFKLPVKHLRASIGI